jgi:hypothetical protein
MNNDENDPNPGYPKCPEHFVTLIWFHQIGQYKAKVFYVAIEVPTNFHWTQSEKSLIPTTFNSLGFI